MFKFSKILVNCTKNSGRLPSISRINLSSSPVVAEVKNPEGEDVPRSTVAKSNLNQKTQHSMVATAFASLNSENVNKINNEINTPHTDTKIASAKTIDEILSISEGNGVSRKHALKVVSVLAEWTSSGKVALNEFEADPRFIRLCKILTKNANTKPNKYDIPSRSEDLSTILNVTADDEAARLVSSITLPQMVKVMTTLSQKKRRSTLLLRALAYNITASADKLDLKKSADLLFSISNLNFPDENLLSKISNDVVAELEGNIQKSAVIGSILTSVGLLKYKNVVLLDALSEWILKQHSICRPQDVFSLFMTLAVLNHIPSNSDKLFEVLIPQLNQSEAGKPLIWLDIVWSLVLLNQATIEHISSVLNESFIKLIEEENTLSLSAKLKLLNINGHARVVVPNYKGPTLPDGSEIINTVILRSKEKKYMVDSVVDTLKNLIRSEDNLGTNVNTGFGFNIDAEFVLDKKCNPLPLNDKTNKEAKKIALMAYDFYDMSKGRVEPTGVNVLASNFLKAQGYKVLSVPFTEFKCRDKLVHRVKYIESKLKEIVNN
ncbi:unnamed protein product [Brassicogethes aeneus]|uniref:Protein TBRG4 n=1 Tax=Brassicogethes aeneus TaxID=1431903 RepID=A0A9P0B081_BRAAE|nr:unnamed protein product [Brassicogethes aeneus]